MNRPFRFLHITTFYPPLSFGGDATYLNRLCHVLGDLGHAVDVVHCADSFHMFHQGPPPLAAKEHPNVTRHEVRSGLGTVSPLATHQTGRAFFKSGTIQRLLERNAYDVIHYHNMSLIGPEAMRWQPKSGPAVKLYTTHEHWLVCPMNVLWKFNERACEKPECIRCTIKSGRPPQLWRATGYLEDCARHVDQFVSPSRFTARMHAERGFPKPVAHLPYFLPRADSDWRNPEPRPVEEPYFLFVGRLEKIKGLDTLIDLWNRRRLPWKLLIAGTGGAEPGLRAQAAGNANIQFVGLKSQRELGALYYHAIASIIPSVTYETFGMINIESFARKTPVIVRDLGALPEVVNDSNGGFIYRTDEELLNAMQSLADSPALRTRLGESGYQAFLRFWTPEAHLQLYWDFIDGAAEKRLGRRLTNEPARAVETC